MRRGGTSVSLSSSNCFGTFGAIDGCSGAPPAYPAETGLQYKNPNVFTDGTVFQTPGMTSSGLSRITWPMPGKDYPVGINPADGTRAYKFCDGPYVSLGNPQRPCSTTPNTGQGITGQAWGILIDARLYNWAADPAGFCTTTTFTTAFGGETDGSADVRCNFSNPISIIGLDMTPPSPCIAAGGPIACTVGGSPTTCVIIRFVGLAGATGGTHIIRDNRYVQPRSIEGASAHACSLAASAGGFDPKGNTLYAAAFNVAAHLSNIGTFNVDIENNYISTNTPNVRLMNYTDLWANTTGGGVNLDVGGWAKEKYNFTGYVNSRWSVFFICTGFEFSYNVALGLSEWIDETHGDWALGHVNPASFACPVDGNGWIDVAWHYLRNNFMIGRANIGGAAYNSVLQGTLTGGGNKNPYVADGDIELNVGVFNWVQPNSAGTGPAYWLPGSAVNSTDLFGPIVNDSATVGTYTVGDILAAEVTATTGVTCPQKPYFRVRALGPTALRMWRGGACDATSPLTAVYPLTCVSCRNGTPTGMTVQLDSHFGWSLVPSGNGMINYGTGGSASMKWQTLSISNNIVSGFGLTGGNSIYFNNAGPVQACSFTTTGNYDLVTGAVQTVPVTSGGAPNDLVVGGAGC